MGIKFNPLSSTFDQISNVAKFIFDKAISGVAPTNGQVLQYNSLSDQWEPSTIAVSGGDVTGPGSSTDNAIVRFDGTTGKTLQDYTSNAPTISDIGIPSFSTDAYPTSQRIGKNSSVGGIQSVAYGENSSTLQNGVSIGFNADTGPFSIAVGAGAQATASNSFAVGDSAVSLSDFGTAMGPSARVESNNNLSIALGGFNPVTTADRQMVIGGLFGPINQYWFGSTDGRNVAAAFTRDFTFNFPAPSGTDINAPRDFILKAPSGTGIGLGAKLKFQVAPPTTTGNTSNPHESALEVTQDKFLIESTPNSEVSSGDLLNESASFYLNESENLLEVKAKYSDNSIKFGSISLGDNQKGLWSPLSDSVATSKVIDTISLVEFTGAIYELSLFNSSESVSKKQTITVNNAGGNITHTVSNKFGSIIDLAFDAVVNAGNMELTLTNNETYAVTVEGGRLKL